MTIFVLYLNSAQFRQPSRPVSFPKPLLYGRVIPHSEIEAIRIFSFGKRGYMTIIDSLERFLEVGIQGWSAKDGCQNRLLSGHYVGHKLANTEY